METILGASSRQCCYPVSEMTQVAAVRRAASDMATTLGFNTTGIGQVSIVVTEAATNILKHAQEGEILLRPLTRADVNGIEILIIDKGPGMANAALCMVDGTSTAGSYGVGLGAIRRLSQEFDFFTAADSGTVIGLVLWNGGIIPAADSVTSGIVCLPMRGETVSGDSWGLAINHDRACVMAADGLGHGPQAAEAAECAVAFVAKRPSARPADLLEHSHNALRSGRGAAVAIAALDPVERQLTFAGIGNIAAHVYHRDGAERRQMVSHNGIVGNNMRKVQEFCTPWLPGGLLILHSDGLTTRWDLTRYPGIFACHPRVIAAVLYRDFTRGRDDVSVVIIRNQFDET